MEIADRIALVDHGTIEQVGTPAELYDRPANEFVLTFLGPATHVAGRWVRPHDIVLHAAAEPGSVAATVRRVSSLGFEVRVEVDVDGEPAWVQLARPAAAALELEPGRRIWAELPPRDHLRLMPPAERPA